MEQANQGHALPYGEDDWTAQADHAFRTLFATDLAPFLVASGTAANALALASICRSYHAVICAPTAHVQTDECAAPEFFTGGAKLLTAPGPGGKLTPDAIQALAGGQREVHSAKPRAVSISQSTETGQVYTVAEVTAIAQTCRALGLALHMDGARFANACAALGCAPAEITWQAGVDVLCFGGTKNGMAGSEAILFFNPALAEDFGYRRKQAGQLASKMRYLAAPWVGMLGNGAWLRHAAHANACATRFAAAVTNLPGVTLAFPPDANAVFLHLPDPVTTALQSRGWRFYTVAGAARFMFAWDTNPARLDALIADLREATCQSPPPR
jgi:threonine aldolase